VIVLDTSVLIDSLTGPKRSAPRLRATLEQGERLLLPSWSSTSGCAGRGSPKELPAQEALLPSESAIPVSSEQAALSARLYRTVRRPRGREIDIAIAACAITRDAPLWSLNPAGFADIPGQWLA